MGSMYRRGKTWWVQYYRNGRPYRESSKSSKQKDAERLLRKREGEIAEGKVPGIYFDRVRFEELEQDYQTYYQEERKGKALWRVEISLKHLKGQFAGMRATDINTTTVRTYIATRRKDEVSDSTINREIALLKAMLRLGMKCDPPKVARVPHMPKLKESAPRSGFLERKEYETLLEALPSHLRPVLAFGYHTGWRKAEILGLTWDKIDLKAGTVTLDPGTTKNDQGRVIFLNSELRDVLKGQLANRRLGCLYVFHRDGGRIKDFRGAWETACNAAGLQGRLFHDLRRTAVRNSVRAGIPERVCMALSGHKSRSVFDRYNIVSLDDLKEAATRQEAYLRG